MAGCRHYLSSVKRILWYSDMLARMRSPGWAGTVALGAVIPGFPPILTGRGICNYI